MSRILLRVCRFPINSTSFFSLHIYQHTHINTPDIVGLGPERGVWLTSSRWRAANDGKIATLEMRPQQQQQGARIADAGNVPCAPPSRLLDGGASAPPSIRRRRVVAPHQSPRWIRRVLERPAQMLAASGSQVRLGSRGVEGRSGALACPGEGRRRRHY